MQVHPDSGTNHRPQTLFHQPDSLVQRSVHLPLATVLTISPGRLLKFGESCSVTSTTDADLLLRKRTGAGWTEVSRAKLAAGQAWNWNPTECGFYLAELVGGTEPMQRSIAVVDESWAVCQLTVGSFTAEDFADTSHPAGISIDYYLSPSTSVPPDKHAMQDKRWAVYERQFGDALHPHMQAGDFAFLDDKKFGHHDSNWDTLTLDAIKERLRALQDWFVKNGLQPLNRIASYTPSNTLVQACSEVGIRILHSLIPEQNWSDGEWAINHWGMPTCPFWIAPDDFRKAAPRGGPDSVIGMTMNHYHVTLPHLTHWGDFVLSPSHFDRWIRAADSGPHPVRFKQFLRDVVQGWDGVDGEPFFFVAGFEFGRSFGTKKMTRYNRQGMQALIELAGTEKIAFAPSPDVLAYYDRHIDDIPGRIFRQRDSWAGVSIDGKPALVGDSVVIERKEYKSATLEGEALPYFYYDYAIPWKFETRDQNAPTNFATACAQAITVTRNGNTLTLNADKPLARTVPIVLWDAAPLTDEFSARTLSPLDDGRLVTLLEIPPGWSGHHDIALRAGKPLATTFPGKPGWKIQTFGTGDQKHSYLIADLPLIADVTLPVGLKRKASMDSAQEALGEQSPGTLDLTFGPLRGWYRFWGCDVNDIEPPDLSSRKDLPLLSDKWELEVQQHEKTLHEAALKRLKHGGSGTVLEIICGGNLPLGSRSRAAGVDRVVQVHPGAGASEFGDGAIAFGPGRSFWYHPRGLTFKFHVAEADRANGVHVLLNSFDPLNLDASYHVFSSGRKLGAWKLPTSPFNDHAWFSVKLEKKDFSPDGHAAISFSVNQEGLLDDWWKNRGFIAGLHALWVEPA